MAFKNYHTHTYRCLHARNTDEEYVLQAIESGYDVLGFTDHSPWPFPKGFKSRVRMTEEQLPEYVSALNALREKYAGKIRLHIGLECEYYPEYFGWLKEKKEEYRIEYLILGNHTADSTETFFFNGARTPDMIKRYADMVLAGMNTGLFAYVCHPEVAFSNYPEFDLACREMSEQICAEAAHLKIPLEYNLQGNYYRSEGKYHGVGYPCDAFWQIAAEKGCEAIVGIDAHFKEMLAWTDQISDAQALLRGMGIRVHDTLPGLA